MTRTRRSRGLSRMPAGNLVPGFVICVAPSYRPSRSNHVLFRFNTNVGFSDVSEFGSQLFFDANGEAIAHNQMIIRTPHPYGVIKFFVDSTKADPLGSFPNTRRISGYMAPSDTQSGGTGRGRLTRLNKAIVSRIFSALGSSAPLPKAVSIGNGFHDALGQIDQVADTEFAQAFTMLSAIVMHQRENLFCGFLLFP